VPGKIQVARDGMVEQEQSEPDAHAGQPRLEMQPEKNAGFVLRYFMTRYIFRAHHLERKRDGGGQHQQRVDRSSMRESRRPQQPRRGHVVDEIGHPDQS
jgi:hypothetical protein